MNVLYLSYDGALDPLGRSQVVPYLEGLSRAGYRYDLITYEKPEPLGDRQHRGEMEARLMSSGISWHPLPYHRTPSAPATAFDLLRGYLLCKALLPRRRWELVHVRSYPCALIAQRLKQTRGIPFVFDMRGFYPEERVDGGLWRENGLLFRVTKSMEAGFLRDAGGIVTLTRASLPGLRERMERSGSRATLRVIPTSVDLEQFQPDPSPNPGPPVLAYFGSLGTWYLLEEMLMLGQAFLGKAPGSRLRFLLNGEEERLTETARKLGLPSDRMEVRRVPHGGIPGALRGATASFFLIKAAPSKVSSSATKFGESMALGLPVILNRGIGDSAEVVERYRVGVVVDELSSRAYETAVERIQDLALDVETSRRCREVAERHFDLREAVSEYAGLYGDVLTGAAPK